MLRERVRGGAVAEQDVNINDRWVFGGLLALLFWAPIPLGSNRVLPVGMLVQIGRAHV